MLNNEILIKENFYDYYYDIENNEYKIWLDMSQKIKLPQNISFNEILIPTIDS